MAIKPATVERDTEGFWSHPELPHWDESVKSSEIEGWAEDNAIEITLVWFESDAPDCLVESYFDKGFSNISEWQPACDADESFLLSIHDTEDGPVAMFAIPKAGESCQQ